MIKSRSEMPSQALEVDLNGPEGNAFALVGLAKRLAKQLEYDADSIAEEMMSGDYDHLLSVFVEYFPMVTLWRD